MARRSLLPLLVLLLMAIVAWAGTPPTKDAASSTAAQHKTSKKHSSKKTLRKTKTIEHQTNARDLERPPALARHLAKRFETIPGNGGEPSDGPGSAEDEAFMARAFPDTDIPVDRINTMRASFST